MSSGADLSTDSTGPPPALQVRSLTKQFGGVRALNDVSVTVARGEIRGLLGENGSGKSTLIKILAGYHVPDTGAVQVYGREVALPPHARQLDALGVAFVHQDLGLVPGLTVVENLCIPQLAAPENSMRISWRVERARARQLFKRWGVGLDPSARITDLLPIERALLAIMRAVEQLRARQPDDADEYSGEGVLVLDEPTVFLPRTQVQDLFSVVRTLARDGMSVLFVSHDLDEARSLTHRITVLRDGFVVATVDTDKTSESALVELIVGRELRATAIESTQASRPEATLSVRDVSGKVVRDLTLDVHAGEVLGVTGLAGSGSEELPYLLFGAAPASTGHLLIDADSVALASMSPARARALGLALIPADRQRQGAVQGLSVADNVAALVLGAYVKRGILRRKRLASDMGALLERFKVRPADPHVVYSALSGGNQQRVLLAKWLQTKPRALLLHEPTQGVDIAARLEIFKLIRQAASDGAVVLCASTDHDQLAAISDRVLVLAHGRIEAELAGNAVTSEGITEACFTTSTTIGLTP